MKILGPILFIVLFISSCASRPVVNDAIGEDAISFGRMSCKKPYVLSQDCSIFGGAKRKIIIDGFKVKVAGSENGQTILVMDGGGLANELKDAFKLNIGKSNVSEGTNNSFDAVKKFLTDKGIEIYRVRPVVKGSGIKGYVLELNADGYSLIKELGAS